jgi:hypothetical protein
MRNVLVAAIVGKVRVLALAAPGAPAAGDERTEDSVRPPSDNCEESSDGPSERMLEAAVALGRAPLLLGEASSSLEAEAPGSFSGTSTLYEDMEGTMKGTM